MHLIPYYIFGCMQTKIQTDINLVLNHLLCKPIIWAVRMSTLILKGVLKRDICKQKDWAYANRHTWRRSLRKKMAKCNMDRQTTINFVFILLKTRVIYRKSDRETTPIFINNWWCWHSKDLRHTFRLYLGSIDSDMQIVRSSIDL